VGLRFRPVGLRSSVFVFGSSFSTHPEFTVSTYSEFCDILHFEFWKPQTWLITWLRLIDSLTHVYRTLVKLLSAKVSKTWGVVNQVWFRRGVMILCFQYEDLSKILLVSKFETNWPSIKLIITLCAIRHYRGLTFFLSNRQRLLLIPSPGWLLGIISENSFP